MHPLCPAAHCTKSKDSNVMGALTPLDALLAKKSCALSKFWPSFVIQLLKTYHQILVSLAFISN